MTIRQRHATLVFSVLGFMTLAAPAANAQFSIVIRPNATLSSNTAALASFNRAADQWASRITDPVTVYIDANLSSLGSGILGSTSAVFLAANYDTVRDAMVADSAGEADDGIVAFLPTNATFIAALPTGFSLETNTANNQKTLIGTRANFKALNFSGLNNMDSDGTITFSSNFAFDYDSSDGVTSGTYDFESIAAHEIGHLLGFVSSVDDVDTSSSGAVAPTTLDLFRFQNNTASDPSSAAEFATAERSLLTGGDAITDDIMTEYRMSTGVNKGDGRQASHWKDNDITGTTIGVMDPTFGSGQVLRVGAADFRAMDLIGYDIVTAVETPEPGTLALLLPLLGGLKLVRHARRRAADG